MREIKIDKITLNIGSGSDSAKLEKSVKLLQAISGLKPVRTVTHKRIPTWGVRPGLKIGCKVTMRGKKAEELLIRMFKAVGDKMDQHKFDDFGNFSFGIHEYIDIPEVKYDAEIGIIGLEVAVTLKRAGFRVKERRIKSAKLPKKQKITKQESMEFIKQKFEIKMLGEQ